MKIAVNLLNLLAKRTAEIWKISETGVYQYFVKYLVCFTNSHHALDDTTAYRATYLENMIDSIVHRVI
jgi:hypothetical protein